ncbi:MAG: LlaJI family restriction endonuclease [Oscillatoriales cyanobacterium]|nr:MAG: LlaJI family restriction endonuclease [Oscillatoriales cyanobacterium]
MFNFSDLKIVKRRGKGDDFVGIRKSQSGNGFDFCLPHGFQDFPENDYESTKKLFFRMYRMFRRFEEDNLQTGRVILSDRRYQKDQDQASVSSGGVEYSVSMDNDTPILYSKLASIQNLFEAYSELALISLSSKMRKVSCIDYSKIHRYLDKAVYLDGDVAYVDEISQAQPVLKYQGCEIVEMYCYILNEVVLQLEEDVTDEILESLPRISHNANEFRASYLSQDQSLFSEETFEETLSILRDVLEKIDNNTAYKDGDYWSIYDSIEKFLYGQISPGEFDGDFWGITKFSYLWEDLCNSYMFKHHYQTICLADTDITRQDHVNELRGGSHVGNKRFGGRYIYENPSPKYSDEVFEWLECLRLSLDFNPRKFLYKKDDNKSLYGQYRHHVDPTRQLYRQMLPDIIFVREDEQGEGLSLLDYKYVSKDFFKKHQDKDFRDSENKYKEDVAKQLLYETTLQEYLCEKHTIRKVSENAFLIPFYDDTSPFIIIDSGLKDIKGIKIYEANFFLLQEDYIS